MLSLIPRIYLNGIKLISQKGEAILPATLTLHCIVIMFLKMSQE